MEAAASHPWTITLAMSEDEDHCEVTAHLEAGDRSLAGFGRSRRNPTDPKVPKVGEELATARALHDLAQHLTHDAWRMIEEFEPGAHEPAG